jgi:tRNA nucleotidyltransferase (CCA-adding enzyme)
MKNKSFDRFDFSLKGFFIKIFGDKIFLVGGTIRDFLLYHSICNNRDIDLVVIDHTYDEIEKKLNQHGKTSTVGKTFAVVKFTKDGVTFDISVPRKDTKKEKDSHSHKNFIIESGPHISLREDLKRRDFTCNSIALRLIDNEIIDPFNGIGAIEQKKIIMTGPETFFDDPLRILRAARFASVHQFMIDPKIYPHSRDVKLDALSVERITEELFRLLLESKYPSKGLNEYWRLTVLEKLFPKLYDLTLTIQDSVFHPETDDFGHHTVWAHSVIAVDIARQLCNEYKLNEEQSLALLLATLLHDLGKSLTTKWEFKRGRMTITSIFHDIRGVELAKILLSRLKIETRKNFPLKETVLDLIKNHHRIYDLFRNREKIGFKAISRLVRDLDGNDVLLLLLDFADRQAREPDPLDYQQPDQIVQWYLKRKEELHIDQETIKPIIMGKDLIKQGIKPGRQMGAYLKKLYELQLDGEFKTKEDGLKYFSQLKKQKDDKKRNKKSG